MNKQTALILPFKDITKDDIALVGGKGANLGEMVRNGFPVPNGFCVTSNAYWKLLEHNNLTPTIKSILDGLDVHNNTKLQAASKKIKSLIERADIPDDLVQQVFEYYRSLKPGDRNPLVAVRSSATAEDLPDASFAGQQESFLNIKGESNVIETLRKSWASLFGARAIFYRVNKNFDHFKVALATPVQLMIQSEVSGVAFSVNPVDGNKQQIVVEAVWGLGDYMVQGVVTPDHYLVNRPNFNLHSRQVTPQTVMEVFKHPSGVKEVKVPANKVDLPKITDEQIIEIAKLSDKLHKHYYFPQDSEWAMEDGKIYLVQTRPITTLGQLAAKQQYSAQSIDGMKKLLQGVAASPGIACGPVKIIHNIKQLDLVKEGDIMVTVMTAPDYVPGMKRSAAIVTDKGGQTSHAAIVSRELGVPAVVGTKTATRDLTNGQIITVNGGTGEIYAGEPKKTTTAVKDIQAVENLHTATKVYVNLGEPDLAPIIAQGDADGVGLLRAEFMIAQIGTHPKKLIREGKGNIFVEKLAENMAKFTQSFANRPVVYRATDFKTNEYKNLAGGAAFEPEEPNPLMGYRGAYRYICDEEVFSLELKAIKIVREKMGYTNLHLMIPFVHTVDELVKVKRIVSSHGLNRSSSFKLWMMVEIPSNVILLDEFIDVGIDGVSIGSNDLTMLILGADRDNETVAPVYDERNPAVLWALEKIIKTCHKHKITCSICGQAPSVYPDLTAKLVEWGITSVSVSPDAVRRTREIIHQCENRLLKL